MIIAFCERMRIPSYGVELSRRDVQTLRDTACQPSAVLRSACRHAWSPDAFASFQFEVEAERDELAELDGCAPPLSTTATDASGVADSSG
jgi:hypothetical protein